MIASIGADHRLKHFITRNLELNNATFQVYDLGHLNLGTPLTLKKDDLVWQNGKFAPCLYRFDMIRDTLKTHDFAVILDGDTIVRKPIPLTPDFDLAVTVRKKEEWRPKRPEGKINLGVCFITKTILPFLDHWEELAQDLGDQHALNTLIEDKIDKREGIIKTQGITIRLLKTEEYNDYYLTGNSYIEHYKAHLKKKFK